MSAATSVNSGSGSVEPITWSVHGSSIVDWPTTSGAASSPPYTITDAKPVATSLRDDGSAPASCAPSLSPSTNAKQRCMYPNVATCTLARRSTQRPSSTVAIAS